MKEEIQILTNKNLDLSNSMLIVVYPQLVWWV